MVLMWFKMLGHKEPIHSCDMECLNVPVLKMFSNMIPLLQCMHVGIKWTLYVGGITHVKGV
jgi:hypothetical protein